MKVLRKLQVEFGFSGIPLISMVFFNILLIPLGLCGQPPSRPCAGNPWLHSSGGLSGGGVGEQAWARVEDGELDALGISGRGSGHMTFPGNSQSPKA